jgi:two-component system, OmpR family, response regulator
MAKRSDAPASNRSEFTSYFSTATQIPEPPISEQARKRYDDLGIVGVSELAEKGYYASGQAGSSAVRGKALEETTILVVDDDGGAVEVIRRVLEGAGYKTRAARNRAQLAEEVGRTPIPDLILLDVDLAPGLSGFNVLNKLRQHSALRRIPVIMLTMLGGRDNIAKGLGLGAAAYLVKPARPAALVDAVRAVLG